MKDNQQTLLALAEKTVAYGMKQSDQIEVLVKNNFEISTEINLGEISRATKSQEIGASIRVVVGQRLGSAFTNRLNQSILEKSVKRAIAAAKASTSDTTWQDFPQPMKYPKLPSIWDDKIPDTDPSVFVDMSTKMVEQTKKRDAEIIFGEGGAGGFYGWTAYANSNDIAISDRGTGVFAYAAFVTPIESGMTPMVWTIDVNRNFQLDLDYVVENTLKDVHLAKNSAKAKTETGTVIFNASALDGLLTYAFMPAIKGDNVVREKSELADKIGDTVASKILSFTDDGLKENGYATELFDGEGVARQKTALIEKGKLRSFLWNNYWAQRHGETSTGNATRNLRTGVLNIAPTNMIIPGGKRSQEDMISDIKSGYLINGLQGAHSSNQETGDYSVVGNPAFRIKDGKLVGAVHGLMLAGNAFQFIKKAEEVGSDVRAYLSDGGGSVIGPSVQFSDIQVVAKAE
jgi:PmbA protein